MKVVVSLVILLIFFSFFNTFTTTASSNSPVFNLEWRTFLAISPCCTGLVYSLYQWNNNFVALIYYSENKTTLLYFLSSNGNINDIITYKGMKPVYLGSLSGTYLDVILYNTTIIKEILYDKNHKAIPGWSIHLKKLTYVNGAITHDGFYYIYGASFEGERGLISFIWKINNNGKILSKCYPLPNTTVSSVIKAVLYNNSIYAAVTLEAPAISGYIVKLNPVNLQVETAYNTSPVIPIDLGVWREKSEVLALTDNPITKEQEILVFNENLQRYDAFTIPQSVILVGLTPFNNRTIAYGSFYDKTNETRYGLLALFSSNISKVEKILIITGRGNVTITSALQTGLQGLLIGGVQTMSPFISLVYLYYTPYTNTNQTSQNQINPPSNGNSTILNPGLKAVAIGLTSFLIAALVISLYSKKRKV